jgi:hypothetical protein
MNENNVRSLLQDIADHPEPAPRIDIDRARRTGRRRLWGRRAAIPVVVAAVLALVVVLPQALASSALGHNDVTPATFGSAKQKAVTPKPKPSASPAVPSPDGYLNPLVPYAAFGYLPQGYSLSITPSAIHDGFLSTVDNLTITAAQSADGNYIQLSVMPKDGCYGLLSDIPGWSTTQDQQARCSELTGQESGPAPEVNGRIAYWGNNGTDLAWQYAPDSWAVLQALTSGDTGFPVAEAKTLLPKMAASVKIGQTQPIVFPFKLSGAVPADWHPVSATYTVLGTGQYVASELDVAPYLDYAEHGVTGLIIDAGETPEVNGNACPTPTVDPAKGISQVQKDGVSWLVQTPVKSTGTSGNSSNPSPAQPYGALGGNDATACNQQPDNSLYASADLKLNTTGAAQTGGITTILNHLSVLTADPQSWTRTPLAS